MRISLNISRERDILVDIIIVLNHQSLSLSLLFFSLSIFPIVFLILWTSHIFLILFPKKNKILQNTFFLKVINYYFCLLGN